MNKVTSPVPVMAPAPSAPGEVIRSLRKRANLTLSDISRTTRLAVSTLSKLEKGQASLSYDKLVAISRALGVDTAELLGVAPGLGGVASPSGGRRVVHRAGEGRRIETQSYSQLYVATELLNKRFTPIIAELRARSIEEFIAEFGGLIRHPGEEFVFVLEGEIDLHTDLYAPLRLAAGDSLYFDSDMGHAYLKGSEATCRVLAICSGSGAEEQMIETFVDASERRQVVPTQTHEKAATAAHKAPLSTNNRRLSKTEKSFPG